MAVVSFTFTCKCGRNLQAGEQVVGKQLKCTACAAEWAIPALVQSIPIGQNQAPSLGTCDNRMPGLVPDLDGRLLGESKDAGPAAHLPSAQVTTRQDSLPTDIAKDAPLWSVMLLKFARTWWLFVLIPYLCLVFTTRVALPIAYINGWLDPPRPFWRPSSLKFVVEDAASGLLEWTIIFTIVYCPFQIRGRRVK